MGKRNLLTLLFAGLLALGVSAQGPNNSGTYYKNANGKKGEALKTALFNIIKNPSVTSYDGLIEAYKKTDTRADGYVRDWYSNATTFTHVKDKAGNYSKEGDVYNREHSVPSSWFSKASPMYSDIMHVIPTDGYVNNRRSSYPFGEVGSVTYRSANGYSKLGKCKTSGYTGTVFEPNDEVKGDIARIYFYMVTCYEDKISGWTSTGDSKYVFAGNKYPGLTDWVLDMMMRWSKLDPIDDVEKARNIAVYGVQKNRNPFVDYPGLEEYIWGSKKNDTFSYDNYSSDSQALVAPTFSPAGGTYSAPLTVQISTSTPDALICYSIDDEDFEDYTGPLTLTTSCFITAYAQKNGKNSTAVTQEYVIVSGGEEPVPSGNTYVKVESEAELTLGGEYLLVCESNEKALSNSAGDVRNPADVTIKSGRIETETGGTLPHILLLGGSKGAYTFQDQTDKMYLSLEGNSNKLNSSATLTDNTKWTVSISSGTALISNAVYPKRSIKYNDSAPRFATYNSGQKDVSLFKRTSTTGLSKLLGGSQQKVNVYSADGRLVRSNVAAKEAMQGLQPGIYVVNGRKILKRR